MNVGAKTATVCSISETGVLLATIAPFWLVDYYSPFLIFVWFVVSNFLWACLLRRFFDYPLGYLRIDGDSAFWWQLYSFHIMWANRIVPNVLPATILPIFYRIRGAKIGSNTLLGGEIVEPELVEIGDNAILGQGALMSAHAIVGNEAYFERVIVEENVTIGMNAVIFPGTKIAKNSIVGACALVPKNTIIGPNEIWLGNPAKCVGHREVPDFDSTHDQ